MRSKRCQFDLITNFLEPLSFRSVKRLNTLKDNQYTLISCGRCWGLLKRVLQVGQKRGQIDLMSMRSKRGQFDLIIIFLEPLTFRRVTRLNTLKVNQYALITCGGYWGLLIRVF